MGLYLGKKKLCKYEIKKDVKNPMKEFFDNGGKIGSQYVQRPFASIDGWFRPEDASDVANMSNMFYNLPNLTGVPSMDAGNATDLSNAFYGCSSLATISMYGMKVSFDISASTKFTREALVEILNNLASVSATQTLTMGSTNLTKLTDDDKAIATGKGWTLV